MNPFKSSLLKTSKNILVSILLILISAQVSFSEGRAETSFLSYSDESDVIRRAESLMQDERYQEAYNVLEAGPIPLDTLDYGSWLKALSLSNTSNIETALNICLEQIRKGGENEWLSKIKFLAAEIYIKKKDFESAGRLYQEEASRLLSEERKESIANVYLDFAEKLAYEPGSTELEMPDPDYLQAYNFYAKAYDMEISEELKEQIKFNMARMQDKAGRYYNAVNEYKAYLSEFDLLYGNSGNKQVQYQGNHVAEARYRLAENYIKTYRYTDARKEQEDLIKFLEDILSGNIVNNTLKGDLDTPSEMTKWLRLAKRRVPFSYTFPYPGSVTELEAGLKATDDFLNNYPDDPVSVTLAWNAIEALKLYNRTDETIEAADNFLEKKNFSVLINETEEDIKYRKEIGINETPSEQYEGLQKKALYLTGELYFQQKEYEKAIQVFTQYTVKFPDGPDWTNAQHGIVNSEFRIGIEYLEEKDYENVSLLWNEFLEKHPLDERSRQILFTFAQIDYQRGIDEEDSGNKSTSVMYFNRAVAGFNRLVSKYPNTEESSLAQYRTGEIYENHLMDLTNALEAYRKVTWGSYYYPAQDKVRSMTDKEMLARTERVYRTNEDAFVTLQLRNVSSVKINAYKLNMEDYFHKFHRITGVEELDLALIAPDITWEEDIDGYMDYLPLEKKIKIPFSGPGVYAVNVSEEELEATTLVICSDIDMVYKSSREEVLVFVQNMKNNTPEANSDVLITDGNKVLVEGKTGSDGVLQAGISEFEDINNICVFVKKQGNIASNVLSIYGLGYSRGLAPKGYIYTDRPVYMPGYTVNFRGIIRDVINGSYSVKEGRKMDCTVSDVNGRIIFKDEINISKFGTFERALVLGENASLGNYRILLKDSETEQAFSGTFLVEEYKLEKVQIELDFNRDVYFRGEIIEGLFKASYYFGEPLINTEITYTLPEGRTLKGETDVNGELAFRFDTSSFSPGSSLSFSGMIPSENVSVRNDIILAALGFNAGISVSKPVTLAGEPVELLITTIDAKGTPVSKELELTVLKREVQYIDPIIDNVPWITKPVNTWAEKTVESRTVRTDQNGIVRISIIPEEGGQYVYRIKGTDRFGNIVSTEGFSLVSGDDDSVKLRLFTDTNHYKVGENALVNIHSRIGEKKTALITFEGEGIIEYRIMQISEGLNPVQFMIEHDHFPNFTFNAVIMDSNRLRSSSVPITVERELVINILPEKEVYEPGEKAVINIEVLDHLGNPVETELSLAIVNEAVFARYADPSGNIVDFFTSGSVRQTEMRMETSCTFSYTPETKLLDLTLLEENERIAQYEKDYENKPLMLNDDLSGYLYAEEDTGAGDEMASPPYDEPETATTGEYDKKEAEPSIEPERRAEDSGKYGYWEIFTVTDASGKSSAQVELPDSIAKYRITAKGCTAETLVGEETANIIISKDFFANIKLPEALQEGDLVRFTGEIHSTSDYKGQVNAVLTIVQGTSKETFAEEINLGNSTAFVFPEYEVLEGPDIELTLDVNAGAEGNKNLKDSLRAEIPVIPWGLVYYSVESGSADNDKTVFIELPEEKNYQNINMNVNLSGSVNRELVDIVFNRIETNRYLADNQFIYSPGVVPSELLAFTSLIKYLENTGLFTDSLEEAVRGAQALVSQLTSTQEYNGSWDFGSYKDTVENTCLAYWALADSINAGVSVDAEIMKSAKTYLINEYTGADQENYGLRAMILHALSKTGDADYTYVNRLYRKRNDISESALAYTALCLASLDRNEMGREIINILDTKAVLKTEGNAYWNGEENIIWERNPVETTAVILLAYEELVPDSEYIEKTVMYLLDCKKSYGFNPAKAKGPVISALTNYYSIVKPEMNDYKLDVYVNNNFVKTIDSEHGLGRVNLEIASEYLLNGENKIEFKLNGTGEYYYSAELTGFLNEFNSVSSWKDPDIDDREYIHQNLTYDGVEIAESTMEINELEYGHVARVKIEVNDYTGERYLVLTDNIPAGATVIEDSAVGAFKMYKATGNRIQFYFEPGQYIYDITYYIAGYIPGTYKTIPAVFRDLFNPELMYVGEPSELVLLGKDENMQQEYVMNKGELYGLGKAYFESGRNNKALELLEKLYEIDNEYNNEEVSEMLLWLRSEPEYYNAEKLVDYFEVLKEKNPELYIPFEKILIIGRAYNDIGEYERAYLVYRATVDASFIKDAPVGGTLEQSGEFIGSIDFMLKLWQEYPDNSRAMETYFALAQEVYNRAPEAGELSKNTETGGFTKNDMYNEAEYMLWRFMSLYPDNPLADDSAFTMVNIKLDKEDYIESVALCDQYTSRHSESDYKTSFQYMKALALFSMRKYSEASDTAKLVAEGESEDKDLANYILGQIYHTEQKPEEAINYYRRVEDLYPDAKEAIEYFEAKNINMDEVINFKPGDNIDFTLNYRNIREAYFQVYKVDLMSLYLKEKNLSRITSINLSGISPLVEKEIILGNGEDYKDMEKEISLNLTDEGAYLVICRGDDLFTSGLILITPLEIEVQEDPESGRVRVNVINTQTGNYADNVHVKVIGSENSSFISGDTDMRGIFIADNIMGTATVIVRGLENIYAFHRGEGVLQPGYYYDIETENKPDYRGNLTEQQKSMQMENRLNLDNLYLEMEEGVQIQDAY